MRRCGGGGGTNLRRYLLKKAVTVVLTVLLISSVNFFIFQVLPGDPTYAIIPRGGNGIGGNCTGNQVGNAQCGLRAELIAAWGLDKPLPQRYLIYMSNLLQGNFGTSITVRPGVPVTQVIGPVLSTTLILIGLATFLTMWLGIVLGRISGWRRGSGTDVSITLFTLIGYSMPSFWVSLILIFGLAYVAHLFPLRLQISPDPLVNGLDTLYYWSLPVLAFMLTNVAWFSLTLRNSLTDVLPEDYMVTAAAKGLTERQQLHWHALPNARLPLVTASALYFGWIVSGVIVIETVFNINGVGLLTWNATKLNDYPLLGAIFLVATIGVVIGNAVADLLYTLLDPRVREG